MPLKGIYNPGQSGSELTGHVSEQQGGTYMNREPAKKGQPSPQDPRSRVYHNLANKYSETSSYSTDTMLPANDGNDVYEEAGVQGLCTDIYEVAEQNKTTQGTQQKLVDTGLATLEDLDTTYGNGDSCPGSRKSSMCMYGNADSPRVSCCEIGQAVNFNMALKSSGNLSPLKPDHSITGNSILAYDNLNKELKSNSDVLTTVFGQGSTDPEDNEYIYGNAESREASRNNSLVGQDNRESGQANGNSLQTSFANSVDFCAGGISTVTFSEDDCARFQMGESNAGNGLDIHHLSTYETPNVSGNASTSAGLSEEAATEDMTYETPNVSGNTSTPAGLSEEAATDDLTYGNAPSPNGSRRVSAELSCTEVSTRDSFQASGVSSQQDGGKAEETLNMGPNQTPNVSATATRKSSNLGDATANLPDQYPTSDKSLQPSNACLALSDGQGQVSTGNVPVQRQPLSSHAGANSLISAVPQGDTKPPGSTVSRASSSAAGFSAAVGKKTPAPISNEMKQLQPLPVVNIPTSTTSADDIYADLPEANEAQEEFIEPSFSSVKEEDDGVYGTIN